MKIGSFEFNLRELAGSMGDFGTLLPLAIGLITVCGLNPAGLLIMMGMANIVTGVIYRLPMPIEPMKALAVVAIAGAWSPEMLFTAGLLMGLFWLIMGATDAISPIVKRIPRSVVRGVQLSLGIILAAEGLRMMSEWWPIAAASLAIILLLRSNRFAPAAFVLVAMGIAIMGLRGELAEVAGISLSLPPLTSVDLSVAWPVFRDGGLAQIPLTATNAVIATTTLISFYFPDRKVSGRKLSFNMGIMNVIVPFFGGMPMCHGAGGLAGQYYFGARTGGANIIEGVIEISLGVFLAASIASIFAAFPLAILGAMMFMVGLSLAKFTRDLRVGRDWIPLGATVFGSIFFNMAGGFALGMFVYYIGKLFSRKVDAK